MAILKFFPRNSFTWQLNTFLVLIGIGFSRGFKLANVFILVNEARSSYFQVLLSRCSITAVYFCHFLKMLNCPDYINIFHEQFDKRMLQIRNLSWVKIKKKKQSVKNSQLLGMF